MAQTNSFFVMIWTVTLMVGASQSHRILFLFPVPAKSHFTTGVALANELARRGHQVTVVTSFPAEKPLYREIAIDLKTFENHTLFNNDHASLRPRLLYALYLWETIHDLMDGILSTTQLQDLINSKDTYDLIIGDLGFYQPCLAAFAHKFRAPLIDFASLPARTFTLAFSGNPHPFSYVPDVLPFTDRMSFGERLYSTAFGVTTLLCSYFYGLPKHEALVRKHFKYPGVEDRPSLLEQLRNISVVFVNAHFSTDYPRPLSPNVIEVGGLALRPVGKLPLEIQKFMDEAKDGVIFISFGTVVKTSMISKEKLQVIVTATKRLNLKFIIKWDTAAHFQNLKNVLVVPWAPQQEILAHPNVRLFVTHGGYNSLIEVIYAGVPALGVPFLGDQFRNVRFFEEKGIGKALDFDTLTTDQLVDSINTIIHTPTFRENVKELSRRTKDRPETAMDTAVFWTEYVLRHKGASHLKPYSVYLPYYQYLLLDVISVSFITVFIISYVTYKLIRNLCIVLHSRSTLTQVENLKEKQS
uniref:UDP-gluconosyltransferase n=1 Tax=Trialeurodes vaporariorum TaxID=88556 RepID=A0A873P513_TRIVP|nr:UDP-gluconosyltransferase [Trialeurodes vaporariorum]